MILQTNISLGDSGKQVPAEIAQLQFLRVHRWSHSMSTAIRLGWLFQPLLGGFISSRFWLNDLEHQETLFKRLLYSYLTSTPDKWEMQRAVQVKIRLQEDPLRLQLREVMNSISSRGVLKTALNPLGSQQSPCAVFQSWALPLQYFIHHQQAPQHHQYLPFYAHFTPWSADHATPLAFHIFWTPKQCLLSKYTGWNLHVHKKVAWRALHAPTALSLFITLQGFTCENKV